MDIAVLIKVVPDLDKLRYDRVTKRVLRDGAELFPNPFDQRALRVALDLRRPGERVTALSMGPPGAETALRDALALGADRAVLLSDPAFAGADTLATARVLVRGLERVRHDLVLAGRWTTDSETGQIGPQVAGLLGVPVLSGARAIQRGADGGPLEVTVDTEAGWARFQLRAPCVITVGEKIVKLRKPTAAEIEAVRARPIERWNSEELGLALERVGAAGSPTVVETLRDEEPTRLGRILAQGSAADRVERALALVAPRLAGDPEVTPPFHALAAPLPDRSEVAVLATEENGQLSERALPLLSEIRRRLPGYWPSAICLGDPLSAAQRSAISRAGGALVHYVQMPSGFVPSRSAALALDAVLDSRPALAGLVLLSDAFGRDVAGQVSARRGLGLTGDAIGFGVDPSHTLVWDKPAFGGGAIASITSRTRPSMATVRPGLHDVGEDREPAELPVRVHPFLAPPVTIVALGTGSERDDRFGDLERAALIVSVGMGLGGPDAIEGLRASVRRLGGAVGATRRVVDAGWVPRQLQIGLTGRSVAPRLAILLGSGASTNHRIGFRRARAIVAVNRDANAPGLRGVDAAIVGDWQEIWSELERQLPALPGLRTGPSAPPH